MRIALVLSAPPAYSETFFNNKISILQDSGIEVDLFTNTGGKSPIAYTRSFSSGNGMVKDTLSAIQAVFRIGVSLPTAIRLFRLNKQDGFNLKRNIRSLLICAHLLRSRHDWVSFGFATLAIDRENLAKAKRSKLATSIRGYDISVYPLKFPNCYQLLWKRLDKLHYISDDLLNKAIEAGFNISTDHVKITPAIHSSFFTPESMPSKLPASESGMYKFTTVARLHWKKGLVHTLIALAEIKDRNIPFEYEIIGTGNEKERILYAAQELGLTDNITLPGKLSKEEIRERLSQTDIYIQYSIQEGFCNSLLEAQCMGNLCIASDAEGLSENILDKQTGWIVPKLKPALLADKLIEVIHMPKEQLNAIRKKSSERVREQFDLQNQKSQFVEFYSK